MSKANHHSNTLCRLFKNRSLEKTVTGLISDKNRSIVASRADHLDVRRDINDCKKKGKKKGKSKKETLGTSIIGGTLRFQRKKGTFYEDENVAKTRQVCCL